MNIHPTYINVTISTVSLGARATAADKAALVARVEVKLENDYPGVTRDIATGVLDMIDSDGFGTIEDVTWLVGLLVAEHCAGAITAETIDLGNNESMTRGIFDNADGTFLAMTFTQSKTFKTRAGAERWLARKMAA